MNIIVFEEESYYRMLEEMKSFLTESIASAPSLPDSEDNGKELWVSGEQAQEILGVKRDKLQQLRDNLEIKFSQHGRTIRYYKQSLYEFLERYAQVA